MRFLRLLLLWFVFVLSSAWAEEKVRVSSFSTVLTEIAGQVGGERVAVTGHVQAGVDPHEFEPKPGDMKIVAGAQVVLLTARHMESYVGKLKEASGTKADFVEVGEGFRLLKMKDEHDDAKLVEDPHWWHSVANVRKAVAIVRDALTRAAPADRESFAANAARYVDRLESLQKWAKAKIAELPRDRRKLVTSHDAFQYFAREYGFTIFAIEGVSTADQPSSKRVGELIAAIKAQRVKAIFVESIENPKVLQEITKETGAKVGGELYADGLGTGEAATYEGMFRHNVRIIVDALK